MLAFHIMESPMRGVKVIELYPSIPKGSDPELEDTTTERISVAPTIEGCIKGLMAEAGMPDWAEVPKAVSKSRSASVFITTITPDKSVHAPTDREVFDVDSTQEFWILEPSEFLYLGDIGMDPNRHVWWWIPKC